MRFLDVIDVSPWPSLPVFLASALMPFVFVALQSVDWSGLSGPQDAPDALMATVLLRIILHLAIKFPAALRYTRGQTSADPMLCLSAVTASAVMVSLVWSNSAAAAQAIWALLLCMIGSVELWQALHRERMPLDHSGERRPAAERFDASFVSAINLMIFAVVGAGFSVLASDMAWVVYAAIGWIVQYWLIAWLWIVVAVAAPTTQPGR